MATQVAVGSDKEGLRDHDDTPSGVKKHNSPVFKMEASGTLRTTNLQ